MYWDSSKEGLRCVLIQSREDGGGGGGGGGVVAYLSWQLKNHE